MCQDRLAVGEAPASAQACPNQAIRITIVDRQSVIDASEAGLFLPGAPEPSYTLPTTIFQTAKALPRNLLPADYFTVNRAHSHWPLILMLVFTQMSVGAFAVEMLTHSNAQELALQASSETSQQMILQPARLTQVIGSLVIGACGLLAAVGHLGRPFYAFRRAVGIAYFVDESRDTRLWVVSVLERAVCIFCLSNWSIRSYYGLFGDVFRHSRCRLFGDDLHRYSSSNMACDSYLATVYSYNDTSRFDQLACAKSV